MSHVVHFGESVIRPYAPRALVVYVGDNDIGAGKTPETVVADFQALVEEFGLVQQALLSFLLRFS